MRTMWRQSPRKLQGVRTLPQHAKRIQIRTRIAHNAHNQYTPTQMTTTRILVATQHIPTQTTTTCNLAATYSQEATQM